MKIYKLLLTAVSLATAGILYAEPASVSLRAEQWDMPRHGETLIKQPQLGEMVRAWMADPNARIEIRYPGGEEGELWMRELMDWLIALGVPSSAMTSIPGSGGEDVIKLVLVPAS